MTDECGLCCTSQEPKPIVLGIIGMLDWQPGNRLAETKVFQTFGSRKLLEIAHDLRANERASENVSIGNNFNDRIETAER